MRCFMWQENMVLMSKSVQGARRVVRAASSGDELDVCSSQAGWDRCLLFVSFICRVCALCLRAALPRPDAAVRAR